MGGFLTDLKSDYFAAAVVSAAGAAVVSAAGAAVVSTAAGASIVVESVVVSVASSVLPPPQEVIKAVRAKIANTFFILSLFLV
jgi:hypothetical protein